MEWINIDSFKMKLNILKHSSEDCMIFPTEALFGNLFTLNIIFCLSEDIIQWM